MAGRLKPLHVEREEKPGKYADGDDRITLQRIVPCGSASALDKEKRPPA